MDKSINFNIDNIFLIIILNIFFYLFYKLKCITILCIPNNEYIHYFFFSFIGHNIIKTTMNFMANKTPFT